MKSRKALEAYNQFQSGWVKRVKINDQGRSRASILQALAMHSQRNPLHPWIAADKDDAMIRVVCHTPTPPSIYVPAKSTLKLTSASINVRSFGLIFLCLIMLEIKDYRKFSVKTLYK